MKRRTLFGFNRGLGRRRGVSGAGCDDAEQNAGAMRALGAAGEKQIETELATYWNTRSVGELSIGMRGSSMKRKSARSGRISLLSLRYREQLAHALVEPRELLDELGDLSALLRELSAKRRILFRIRSANPVVTAHSGLPQSPKSACAGAVDLQPMRTEARKKQVTYRAGGATVARLRNGSQDGGNYTDSLLVLNTLL
jgi:hypothetical protein